MELNIKIDTDKPEEFQEAIQLLTASYDAMYEHDQGGIAGPGDVIETIQTAMDNCIEHVQPYQDDFEEAEDSPGTDEGGIIVPEPMATTVEKVAENGESITSTVHYVKVGVTLPESIELDADGLPHDKRIHNTIKNDDGSFKKIKSGTWKLRKGVDKDLVERVRKEQREALQAPTAIDPPSEPDETPNAAAVFTQSATPVTEVPPPPATEAPVNEVPPPPATEAPTPEVVEFPTVLMYCTNKLATDKAALFQAELAKILSKHGLKVINQLAVRPDLVQPIYLELQQSWNNMQG